MMSLNQQALKPLALVTLVIGMLAGSLVTVPAQELSPDHIAMARRYIDATDQSSIFEATIVQAGIDTLHTVTSQNPELRDPADNAIGNVLRAYAGRKGELLNQFSRLYAIHFDIDEMEQIVDFYESDVGRKLSEKNAIINQDLQTIIGIFRANLQTEFFAAVRADLREQGIEF